ncbi:MAG: hypothetical protein J5527_09765 [Treponema sp.]|nr:hypothetical protein [Treponema sp.]
METNVKKFRLDDDICNKIITLSNEEGCSQTEIIRHCVNFYYQKDVMPEHILMGRMNQIQSQLTAIDRKLETLAGVFYYTMPYILGVIPPLPKNETDSNGKKYNPALDKGNEIFSKLIINYRNQMKSHKISFMQNVWADMQESLNMTHINAASEDSFERSTGN